MPDPIASTMPRSGHHYRFHAPYAHLMSVFGDDAFAVRAEGFARFFGTPTYLVGQTIIVFVWILVNLIGITHFDVYPFILLNLAFSLQAAYAAPLILLAQTRQADRDKIVAEKTDKRHTQIEHGVKAETDKLLALLESNTTLTQQDKDLTEQVATLTREIHALLKQQAAG